MHKNNDLQGVVFKESREQVNSQAQVEHSSLKSTSLKVLQVLSAIILVAYAFALSLPITVPWSILTIGIFILLSQLFLLPRQELSQMWRNLLDAPLLRPILFFAYAVGISAFLNGGIVEALNSLQGLRGMLVYFWAYLLFSQRMNLRKIACSAALLGGFLAGLFATVEQLTGYHPFSFPYLQGTGFLSGPMAFSGLAQLFSCLALGLVIKNGYEELPRPFSNRWLFIIIVLGNFLGLLFCSERSAWFAGIIAVFATSYVVSRRAAIGAIFVLLGTSILSWLFLPVVKERVAALATWQNDVSVSSRLILWQRAWQVFKESPLFGIGIRHFPHLRIEEALRQGHVALDHAHSNYFHILATLGLFGFIAFIYLFYSALKVAYISQKNDDASICDRGIYLGVLAGVVSLMVSGFFEYNFGTGQVRLAQWFLLAMLPALKRSQQV